MKETEHLNRQQRRALERATKKQESAPPLKEPLGIKDPPIGVPLFYKEAKRLAIPTDPLEIKLWPQFRTLPDIKELSDSELKETYGRIQDTFIRMEYSANPYYNASISYLKELQHANRLVLQPLDKIRSNPDARMVVVPDLSENDDISWSFLFSLSQLAHEPNGVGIAQYTVHDTEHIARGEAFFASCGETVTNLEKLELYTDYLQKNRVREEAYAEGKAAVSLIYQIGLGYDVRLDVNKVLDAATYISLGKNPADERWQQYLLEQHNYYKTSR